MLYATRNPLILLAFLLQALHCRDYPVETFHRSPWNSIILYSVPYNFPLKIHRCPLNLVNVLSQMCPFLPDMPFTRISHKILRMHPNLSNQYWMTLCSQKYISNPNYNYIITFPSRFVITFFFFSAVASA